jgi:hypothetical protein
MVQSRPTSGRLFVFKGSDYQDHYFDKDLQGFGFWVDVSPDQRYVLYTHVQYMDNDIMLVENWQ